MAKCVLQWFTVTWVLLAALLMGMATWGFAQTTQNQAETKPAPANSAKRPAAQAPAKVSMTPERQAAALKFAELHHPELFQLLEGLKRSERPAYQQAIRQLYHDSEQLARLKERSASRYELVLKEWQLDSRLRLLVARMTMSTETPEWEAELQDLLKQRVAAHLALLQFDRERLAARLAKMDDLIQEIEADTEAAAAKDLLRVRRSLGLSAKKNSVKGKEPAPNPTPKKTDALPLR